MKVRRFIAVITVLSAVMVVVPAGMANAIGRVGNSCRASAARVTIGSLVIEPAVANPAEDPCVTDDATVLALPTPVAGASVLVARTFGGPLGYSRASVVDAIINIPGVPIIGVEGVSAAAHANCSLTTASTIAHVGIKGNYNAINVNEPVTIPLGIATVYLNRTIPGVNEVTRRAVEVDAPSLGINIVLAEAYADAKKCD